MSAPSDRGVVKGVAAAERRLLGQVGEGDEALRPTRRSQAAVADCDGKPFDDRTNDAAPNRLRKSLVVGGENAGQMLAVAAEEFVSSHAGEHHLDTCVTRGLADQQGVDSGWVADGLVEQVDDARQQFGDLGRDLDLVQRNSVARRNFARVDRVLGHRFAALVLWPECDRVSVDRLVVPLGQHAHDARVEPARQHRRHGDVGDEVRGDRLLNYGSKVDGRPRSRPWPRRQRSTSSGGPLRSRQAGTRPTFPAAACARP